MTRILKRSESRSVGVTIPGNKFKDRSYADADNIYGQGDWWLSRVFVGAGVRREGVGRKLLDELSILVQEKGGISMSVTPGGYTMDYDKQCAFYTACGFFNGTDKDELYTKTL